MSGGSKYVYPCHDSAFQLDGARINEPPPCGLDTLEAKTPAADTIWVKFQKIRAGTAEKKPV